MIEKTKNFDLQSSMIFLRNHLQSGIKYFENILQNLDQSFDTLRYFIYFIELFYTVNKFSNNVLHNRTLPFICSNNVKHLI